MISRSTGNFYAADRTDGQYVMAAFRSTAVSANNNVLYILTSPDGINWTDINGGVPVYTLPGGGGVRDPRLIKIGGYWYCAFTDGVFGAVSYFTIIRSADLYNWIPWTTIDCSSQTGNSLPATWGPVWFVDDDGSVHLTFALSSAGVGGPFLGYILSARDATLKNWSPFLQILQPSLTANSIGHTIAKKDGTYYLFTSAHVPEYVEIATASERMGPYTPAKQNDFAGWGNNLEGNGLVQRPDGTWIIYLDHYSLGGIYYSTSSDLLNWSAKALINTPQVMSNPGVVYVPGRAQGHSEKYLASFSSYPRRATCFHKQSNILVSSGGAITLDRTLANATNGYVAFISPANLGDTFTNGFYLAAGIYTMTFEGAVSTNFGSIDWYIDDVKVIAGQSWTAGAYARSTKVVANIVVKTSGWHVLRGVALGSSPNAYISLTQIDFAPQYD
jgi:hypothetical protein